MLDVLFVPVAILYLSVVGMLFIYGINFFYLTYLTWRSHRSSSSADPLAHSLSTNGYAPVSVAPWPAPACRPGQAGANQNGQRKLGGSDYADWPRVTVQLPIYNELYVAQRLINAAAHLDYPTDLLEIQALDDSTDETVELVRNAVEGWHAQGVNIVQVHRVERTGFKAGALAEGLTQASGEFLAIFDADFVPPPDFLKRTLPHFHDPSIAFIQTRWGHLNRDYSFLTVLQSLAIDAHFMVEQFARSRGGYWFNFNGTAGVWRRSAVEDAGGWKADTLTEDLDLSYRAFLRGWRALYLRDVEVPAELPVNFGAYRRQQGRWARGSLECALKLIPQVWSAPLPLANKLEATLHLTGYGVHLLLWALTLLYPLVLLLSVQYPSLIALFGIAFLFNATAFAPTTFFAVAQQQLGRRWWRQLPVILFITVLGGGMMLNTLRAALQIIWRRHTVFERTPKFGIVQKRQNWTRQRYQLHLDPIVFFELAFALFNLGTVGLAIYVNNWVIAAYAAMFCAGLLFTSGFTITQAIAVRRGQARQSVPQLSSSHLGDLVNRNTSARRRG